MSDHTAKVTCYNRRDMERFSFGNSQQQLCCANDPLLLGKLVPLQLEDSAVPPSVPLRRNHPVLIIPGFMSSRLTVQDSPYKSWRDKQLWLNIALLGFNSMNVGGKLRKNEELWRRCSEIFGGNGDVNEKKNEHNDIGINCTSVDDTIAWEALHNEYMKQVECKSRWLWHLALQSDMITEKEGLVVRPVPGTAGVNYLAPGALTESASYMVGC